ncbi:MAG: hypothetical protein AAFQ61_11960 [Cyanobacteria bacterium J06626_23]
MSCLNAILRHFSSKVRPVHVSREAADERQAQIGVTAIATAAVI